MAESLVFTLLFLLNDSNTRAYFRPSIDLQVLLAPFTETDVPDGTERRQKWNASRTVIVTMMRSWTVCCYLLNVVKI